jgi:polyvinyl alcohol dehydrogenase (cytochrome)
VGDTDDAIIAFDLDTGRRLWSTQLLANDFNKGGCGTTAAELRINCPGFTAGPNDDISGSPILHTLPNGREILIAGQESGRITALDPDGDGAVLWVAQAGDDLGPGGAGMGPAADGELYYRPVALQDQTGGMAALRPATGERVWYTTLPKPTGCSDPQASWCSSGHFGAATVIPGVVFAGAQDGTLRAYSTGDGKVLWEYNTKQEFEAVNGVRNTGGSMGGHGPTVVGGMVFVGSGYNVMSGAPGNVLLAFGLD